MKKWLLVLLIFISLETIAQNTLTERLYYHSAKGLTFIPPLSRPGLVFNGKLYIGKKKLQTLFTQLNDEQLNTYFKKYKANKTTADILTFVGGFALPLVNVFISTQQGKVNWYLIGTSAALNVTGNILNMHAQKNLLLAAGYYDQKKGFANSFVPQQQSIGFTIPLSK